MMAEYVLIKTRTYYILIAWLRHKKSTGFYITFDTLTDKMIHKTNNYYLNKKEGISTNYII